MSASPQRLFGVTLLEKIIRTHPIWYLQHIGRAASNHLLRPMPAGTFIVRASSRSNSMALTVRLPPCFDQDTDHYLIQRHGNGIRLEGSPNSFKSLPLLIEHYCKHGEELQAKLVLPAAISLCKTTMALQRIALMGQDFYTSEVGRVHIASSSSPRKLNRTPPMGTQMLNSNNSCSSSSHMSQSICSTNAYAMSRDKNSNAPKLSKQHTVHVDDYYELSAVAAPPQHSFLKKSMSAHDGIRDPNGSLKDRFDASSGPQTVRVFSKTSRPVNFLRNLFSSQGSTESRNTQNESGCDKITDPTSTIVAAYGSNSLAQCEYFTPFPNQKLCGSQSDASTLASASDNRWSKKMDFRNSSTCKLHQEPSTIESTASSLRRSFAKLKTFKPGGS
uniref:SH2 domain-containing protein n=1 Tax=Acrobeloides nanus TaxID=290746 RepID=A0A914CGE7_9BILA